MTLKRSPLFIKQAGLSLFIALVALAVMSLTAVALIRSVDTNSVIAGNLAFKQAATSSADAGVEAAIAWLEANNGSALNNAIPTAGYSASTSNTSTDKVGVAYWDALSNNTCQLPLTGGVCAAAPVADAAGNTSEFIIQRLCNSSGISTGAGCVVAAGVSSTEGTNQGAGEPSLEFDTRVFYRIVVKVTGPRNTASYVQAIVSL